MKSSKRKLAVFLLAVGCAALALATSTEITPAKQTNASPPSLYGGNRQEKSVGLNGKKPEVDRSAAALKEKDIERKEPREASDYERRLGGQGPEEDPKPNR